MWARRQPIAETTLRPPLDAARRVKRRLLLERERLGSVQREVNRAIVVPGLRRRRRRIVIGSVWAVGLARDEADIVGGTVAHLLGQGVDGIIIVDNNSVDSTKLILEKIANAEPRLHVGTDSLVQFHQGKKTSYLAHLAWRQGADWVVPFDADEQWFAPVGLLSPFLRKLNRGIDLVWADYRGVRPQVGTEFAWQGGLPFQIDTLIEPNRKIAFRSRRWVFVGEGNHAVRCGFSQPQDLLHMLHYSSRSLSQLTMKAMSGTEALSAAQMDASVGAHWRHWANMSSEERESAWNSLARSGSHDPARPHGPRRVVRDPTSWKEWDPEGELSL